MSHIIGDSMILYYMTRKQQLDKQLKKTDDSSSLKKKALELLAEDSVQAIKEQFCSDIPERLRAKEEDKDERSEYLLQIETELSQKKS